MTESLTRDPLTGVLTRRVFEEMVKAEIEKFKRYGAKFSLLLLDLDHFKEVNDSLGHRTGDKILVEMVEKLKSLLRESDVIGRWGGDEFIVLLPYTDEKSAMRVAKRLTENLKIKVGDITVGVSCAFITPKNGEDSSYEKMFSVLDELLYKAKKQGRGRVGNLLDIKDKIVIPSYTFVSREKEYQILKRAFLKEKKKFIVVSGEIGIGKSRLVEEFLKKERPLFVKTHPFGPVNRIPLFAIKNIFMAFFRDNRELFSKVYNTLSEKEKEIVGIFVPTPATQRSLSEEGYEAFFLSKIADVLSEFLEKTGIFTLWIDDLQWLSMESFEIIKNLLRKDNKIQVIGTLRTEERDFFDDYIRENRISVFEIHLGRLDKKDTAELIKGIIGEDISADVASFIWEYSGGIPFYVEEIINFLAQKGYLKEQDGVVHLEKVPHLVPSTLEDIISYKTRSFTEREKQVLWFLAVYRNPVEIERLSRLLSFSKNEALKIINRAIEMGILDKQQNKVFFPGEVIRRIIIKEIPRGKYMMFNRIAGEIKEKEYEKGGIEPFELYKHFKEAHDTRKQAYWAYLSGEESLRRFAPEKAFFYFKEAFFSFEDTEDKKKALLGVIKSGRAAGNTGETLKFVEEYGKEYLDTHLYYFYLGSMYVFTGKLEKALRFLDYAMQHSKDPEFVAECKYEKAWAFRKSGRLNDCIEDLEGALKLNISPRLRATILSLYGGVLLERGNVEKAKEILRKVIEEAEKSNTEYRIPGAYINYALLMASTGWYEEAEKYYKKAIEISEKIGHKDKLPGALNNLGSLYLTLGKLKEAEKCYMRALDLASETGNHSLEVIILNNLGSAARERGIYDEAIKFYTITYQKAKQYGYPEWVSHAISNILMTYANLAPTIEINESMVEELENMIEHIDVPSEKAYAFLALVDYYRERGKFEKAKKYIQLFKKLPPAIKEQYELNFFISMARLYDALNNKKMSDYYMERVRKAADQSDNMTIKAELYFSILEWYHKRNRKRKAKNMLKEVLKLKNWLSRETIGKLYNILEELNESG